MSKQPEGAQVEGLKLPISRLVLGTMTFGDTVDEATSALDVSVQAQVLRLLKSIQDETGITYVFISHNLGVVQEISDSVMVMQKGKLVEAGPTASVLTAPAEDYTRRLRRAALDPSTMRGLKPRHLVRSLALKGA